MSKKDLFELFGLTIQEAFMEYHVQRFKIFFSETRWRDYPHSIRRQSEIAHESILEKVVDSVVGNELVEEM